MYVMLMRHGEAVQMLQNDRERPLTSYGQQQSMQTARWMKEFLTQFNLPQIDLSLVSPFKRAQQTHDAVSTQLTVANTITSDDITPSGNPQVAHDYLLHLVSSRKDVSALLVVSHMPFISYLLDEMSNAQYSMLFSTGAVAVLKYSVASNTGRLAGQFMPE